ncbi:MAG: nitronate monooxygenase, partial [Spirochaetia bacterium]|nr:nitronate monooxygenase [Spirochaetia bacterium]
MQPMNKSTIFTRLKEEARSCLSYLPLEKTVSSILKAKPTWPALRIGDLVAPTPIVQGGMGVGISLSSLASAVANAG